MAQGKQNLSAPLPCPVVVIPGIVASVLRDDYPVTPERVWGLADAALGAVAGWTGHMERVALHPDDLRYELREPARVVTDALFGLPYGELVAELRHNLSLRADEAVPVFPLAYDWRQPLEQAEERLAAMIEEVVGRTRLLSHYHAAGYGTEGFPGRVNLVAHSMGGLVVAGYLERHGFERVHKVVSMGSPFRGSHEAVLKVATGQATLGGSPAGSRAREMARLTPSLYHLLPSYAGAIESVKGVPEDLFDAAAWQPGVVATLSEHIRLHGLDRSDVGGAALRLFERLLAGARRHRERLESLRLPDPAVWLCVVGVGSRTRVRLRIERRGGAPFFNLEGADRENLWNSRGRRTTATGDGTVPYLGARCAFIPASQVVCVAPEDLGYWEVEDRVWQAGSGLHPVLPKLNLVHRLAASHLLGRLTGEVWGRRGPDVPAGERWSPPVPRLCEKDRPGRARRRTRGSVGTL